MKIENSDLQKMPMSLSNYQAIYPVICSYLTIQEYSTVSGVDKDFKKTADIFFDSLVKKNPIMVPFNLKPPHNIPKWSAIFTDILMKIGMQISSMHQSDLSLENKSAITVKVWQEHAPLLKLNRSMEACVAICLHPYALTTMDYKSDFQKQKKMSEKTGIKLKGITIIHKIRKMMADQVDLERVDQKRDIQVNQANAINAMFLGIMDYKATHTHEELLQYPSKIIDQSIINGNPLAALFFKLYRPDVNINIFLPLAKKAFYYGDESAMNLFISQSSIEDLLKLIKSETILDASGPFKPIFVHLSTHYRSAINEENLDHEFFVFLIISYFNGLMGDREEADRIISLALANFSDDFFIHYEDEDHIIDFFHNAIGLKKFFKDEKAVTDLNSRSTIIMEERKKIQS